MAPTKRLGICKVDGCKSPATGRGFCNPHYQNWYRHGSPFPPSYEERLLDRLFEKIEIDQTRGCWIWTGSKAHYGHGVIVIHGKHRPAHRVSWEMHHGPVPEGAMICHHCDVPACINPEHLYVGDAKTNSRDMVERRRQAFGERSGTAKLTEAQVLAIRADRRSRRQIAKDYGVTCEQIGHIKAKKAWRHLDGPIVPAASGGKLTAEDAAAIRDATGRQVDIAARYGISQVMVSRIKRGVAWSNDKDAA